MKLVVGLGNPGFKYAKTRHNIGFWVIDRLSEKWGIPVNKEKWRGEIGEGFVHGEKVILLKPMTYMNLSGESVRAAVDWLKIDLEELCVIYDDLDLSPGQIRLRLKGSSGGHNGMKSIIHHLGSEQFKRIKLGIGRPAGKMSVINFVISSFNEEESEQMTDAVDRAKDAVDKWVETDFLQAMNRYNLRK